MNDEPEHERLPEDWVQALQGSWELTYGEDELARIRSEPMQPIDLYLYDAWVLLRRLAGSILLRLDSNLPLDDQLLRGEARNLVKQAMRHVGEARRLLAEAIGKDRVVELEHEWVEENRRRFEEGDD